MKFGRLFLALALILLILIMVRISDRYPLQYDENWLMSIAYNIAHGRGISSDLFGSTLNLDRHSFLSMPLKPLLIALSFKAFGFGIWQSRIVSMIYAVLTVLATYVLVRKVYGGLYAGLAAGLLLFLRFNYSSRSTGIPLVDHGVNARPDVDLAFWLVLSLLFLSRAEMSPHRIRHLCLGGAAAACALLSHPNGLVLPAAYMVYLAISRRIRSTRPLVFLSAFAICILPYVIWVALHMDAASGQLGIMTGRASFLAPRFYLGNITREPNRYRNMIDAFPEDGVSVVLVLLAVASMISILFVPSSLTWRRPGEEPPLEPRVGNAGRDELIRSPNPGGRDSAFPGQTPVLVAVVLATAAALLAVAEQTKEPNYLILTVPLVAILVPHVVWWLTRRFAFSGSHVVLGMMALVMAEGTVAIVHRIRASSGVEQYDEVANRLAGVMSPDTRVMGLMNYWFGLRERHVFMDYLAIEFALKAKLVDSPIADPEEEFLQLFHNAAPTYLLVDDRWKRWIQYYTNEFRTGWERMASSGIMIPVDTLHTRSYGEIEVWRVQVGHRSD